jgi:hypothetical protein
MKRRHILLIFILLSGGWLAAWHLLPIQHIELLVVDKTVPEPDWREHRAIFWVAEHRRFADRESGFYRADRDYLGFHPLEERKEFVTAAALTDLDLLYLADSYGIYSYEEGLAVYEEQLPYSHQQVELILGGFDRKEVDAIADFAEQDEALLVGEHNIFGYPTYLDPDASVMLQKIFGVTYTGWLVRYYSNLDESAFWLKELYTRIYGREWNFDGSGLVFAREENSDFGWNRDLVIIERADLSGPWPAIINSEHQLLQNANSNVPYLYWIELLELNPDSKALAYFELPVREEAREPLKARGLPLKIPAMVYYAPPGQAERIYFAGDFADQLPALLSPRLTGSAGLQRFFTYLPGLPAEFRFYFQWYEPVLKNILQIGSDTQTSRQLQAEDENR